MRKKLIVTLSLSLSLLASVYASASPVTVYSELRGIDEAEARVERQESGLSFGKLAIENGFFEAFRNAMGNLKFDRLASLVEQGTISQEEADNLVAQIEERQLSCPMDGSGSKELEGILNLKEYMSKEQRLEENKNCFENLQIRESKGQRKGEQLNRSQNLKKSLQLNKAN